LIQPYKVLIMVKQKQ